MSMFPNWSKKPLGARLWIGIVFLIFSALLARLLWLGAGHGYDYQVYDFAAREWWALRDPYLVRPEMHGFVFKYPPWVLPIWLPLALFSKWISNFLWALIQAFALLSTVRWMIHSGVRLRIVLWVTLAFFFIFLEHFVAGQFTLPMMALTLWALSSGESAGEGAKRGAPEVLLVLGLSGKVFNLWTLGGVLPRLFNRRTLLITLVAACVLFAVGGLPYWVAGRSPVDLMQTWLATARSGAQELGSGIVRGPGNHSLVNFFMRMLGVPAEHPWADLACGMSLGALASLYLFWISRTREIPRGAVYAGWLAVGLLANPLGWVHSYVLGLPLVAWGFELAKRQVNGKQSKKFYLIWVLAFLALFGVALAIPQVIRSENVVFFDGIAAKGWGVVAGLALLGFVRK